MNFKSLIISSISFLIIVPPHPEHTYEFNYIIKILLGYIEK